MQEGRCDFNLKQKFWNVLIHWGLRTWHSFEECTVGLFSPPPAGMGLFPRFYPRPRGDGILSPVRVPERGEAIPAGTGTGTNLSQNGLIFRYFDQNFKIFSHISANNFIFLTFNYNLNFFHKYEYLWRSSLVLIFTLIKLCFYFT